MEVVNFFQRFLQGKIAVKSLRDVSQGTTVLSQAMDNIFAVSPNERLSHLGLTVKVSDYRYKGCRIEFRHGQLLNCWRS